MPAGSASFQVMRVTLRCFATVKELLGADTLTLDLPDGATVETLKARLAERAPRLARLPVACAVNRAYAPADRALRDGDEVALIPPISGGSAARWRFDLVPGPLDPRALEAEVRTDADGAVVTFAGTARDHNDGQAVESLAYEAYAEMARAVLERLLAQAVAELAVSRVRVAHRLGPVPIGEAAVLVVVAAPHRGAAFDACRWLMDRIKAEVPIFKKERLAGGGERWVGDLPQQRG